MGESKDTAAERSEELNPEAKDTIADRSLGFNWRTKNTIAVSSLEFDLDEILSKNLEKENIQPVPEFESEEPENEFNDEDEEIKVSRPRQRGIYRPGK